MDFDLKINFPKPQTVLMRFWGSLNAPSVYSAYSTLPNIRHGPNSRHGTIFLRNSIKNMDQIRGFY